MKIFIVISLLLVLLSIIGLLVRIIRGPSTPDRLVALDAISVVIISSTALMSMLFQTGFLIEIILLLAIMSFIGTIAFSKFIEKGRIIDRDNNS